MEKHLCRGEILLYFICGMPGMLATYCLETTMMLVYNIKGGGMFGRWW